MKHETHYRLSGDAIRRSDRLDSTRVVAERMPLVRLKVQVLLQRCISLSTSFSLAVFAGHSTFCGLRLQLRLQLSADRVQLVLSGAL